MSFWELLGSKFFFLLFVLSHCGIFANVEECKFKQYPDQPPLKPQFFNCPKSVISLAEEQSSDTKVYQLNAGYQDGSKHGDLVYEMPFVNPNDTPSFRIDSSNGWIKTARQFDRDFPTLDKEFYVVVTVNNVKYQHHVAACSFKIDITDIDDNTPIFDKIEYSISVPQNFTVGKAAMQLFALDRDENKDSIIRYEKINYHKYGYTEAWNYFDVDGLTGVVSLKKKIDTSPMSNYYAKVQATEIGAKFRSSWVFFYVTIIHPNNKPPSCDRRLPKVMEVPEDLSLDTSFLEFNVNSNVEDDPTFDVEVNSDLSEVDKSEKSRFRFEKKGNHVSIKLAFPLDYEKKTSHRLNIVIRNGILLTTRIPVVIKVLDVNDCTPSFLKIDTGSIYENVEVGTEVGYVHAFDNDVTFEYNQVSYKLLNYQHLFEINPINGTIKSLIVFDRENKSRYDVKVMAFDNALNLNASNYKIHDFVIYILDQNDTPPKFGNSVFTIPIRDGAREDDQVYQVTAEDLDEDSQFTYNITGGNLDDTFRIEEETGWIMVKKDLDRTKIPEYNLIIEASDGIFRETTQVRINVEESL